MCIQGFEIPTRSRLPGVLRVLSALVFAAAAMLGAWSARAERVEDLGPTRRVPPTPPIGSGIVVGPEANGDRTMPTPFAAHGTSTTGRRGDDTSGL